MAVQHYNFKGRPVNRVCPQCQLNLMPECTVCPQCGASVPVQPGAQTPATPAAPAQSMGNVSAAAPAADRPVFCGRCGAKNTAQARFCGQCGAPMIHPEGRA